LEVLALSLPQLAYLYQVTRYLSGTDGTDLKNKDLLNNLSGTKSKSVSHKKNDSFNKNKGVPLVPAGASLLGRNWDN
jgi:hypothetical protein